MGGAPLGIRSDAAASGAWNPLGGLARAIGVQAALDHRLGLVVFRVVYDDHTGVTVAVGALQQPPRHELGDQGFGRDPAQPGEGAEAVQHVVARVAEGRGPYAEGGRAGDARLVVGARPVGRRVAPPGHYLLRPIGFRSDTVGVGARNPDA